MPNAPYVAPSPQLDAFNCPICRAYAQQATYWLVFSSEMTDFKGSKCGRCTGITVWSGSQMLFPNEVAVADAHPDLPENCKEDFEEARQIFARSPRGAAALLRLAIQKLMVDLGQPGENINSDIAALVKQGLSPQIQQALDVCRVVGNHAVHPGEIDLNATPETARALFDLINFIVDDRISKPKQVQELFNALPLGALEAIEKRDAPKG